MTQNWKRMLRLVLIITAAICLGAAVANWAKAQDRATVVPGMKVLFENDCVRVQYHDVAVGGKVPMHSHPAYIVYTLKPFKARITLPDGTQRISEHQAGEAYWNPPITHAVENLGNTDIHNLIVELKPGGKCQ
jgi:quercetin dioxygenase-like cupin family protein